MGMTQMPTELDPKLAEALEEAAAPPREHLSPGQWLHKRLFNSWYNSIITVVLSVVVAVVLYQLLRFIFVTARWEAVSRNLELFMVGRFPRGERRRLITQIVVMGLGMGFSLGTIGATARDRARESGQALERTAWYIYVRSFWAVSLFVVVVLVGFTSTPGPTLVALAGVGAIAAGWVITRILPRSLRNLGWSLAALATVAQFQVLSGTGGLAWLFTTAALVPVVSMVVARFAENPPAVVTWVAVAAASILAASELVAGNRTFGIVTTALAVSAIAMAVAGNLSGALRPAALVGVALVVFQVNAAIDHSGVDWRNWGGLHLNLVGVSVGVMLAFPLGMLLALGRRSKLPAIRTVCIGYIEFFRGVPLITLLLAAAFFLGFFLDTRTPLSLLTRAIAAVTLFASAYIAEIIRGGLQSIPPGQVEAGLASGLNHFKVLQLIVMPQALRAVIPPMVGQFISLFMDTTLFSLIGIGEFLNVRGFVHGQLEFQRIARAETLAFVAFGFWALGYTMSREAHRLEHRLGIGHR